MQKSLMLALGAALTIPSVVYTAEEASEPGEAPVAPVSAAEQKLNELAPGIDAETMRRYLEAESLYQRAKAKYQKLEYNEAYSLIQQSITVFPGHPDAQAMRESIIAALSGRNEKVQTRISDLQEQKAVAIQEQAVRIAGLIQEGDEAFASEEYSQALKAYDRASIAMRTFIFEYDWGDLPAEVRMKMEEAQKLSREKEFSKRQEDRIESQRKKNELRVMEERILKNKVDEILRRAIQAYDRRDFHKAKNLARDAYELDRRREDARNLMLDSQRQHHVQFDNWFLEERDEALARANEQMHQTLIPQTDLLLYPKDWFRRSKRKPVELGESTEQPWMQEIRDKLEQEVTLQFEDAELSEVVEFLTATTGVNFVVATEILADGSVAPINLDLTDMKLATALQWILRLTGLQMSIRNQAIYISEEESEGDIALRIYDVSDLLAPIQDFQGLELAFNAAGDDIGGGIFDFPDEPEEADPDDFIDFLQQSVAPDSWDEPAGIELGPGNMLFVGNTIDVHEQIEALLINLRNQSSLQVQVKIRLLDVEKNFFEEIGWDWNALNSTTKTTFQSQLNNTLPDPESSGGFDPTSTGMVHNHSFNIQGTLSLPQVNAVLTAAESEGDRQIVIAPEITCFNGQRANASFIQQYAYIEDFDIVVSGDGIGTVDAVINVLNFGDIIDVRPIVSSDRKYITMEIRPTSSIFVEAPLADILVLTVIANAITPVYLPIELPEVRVRALRTNVMLPDQGTVVVGGFTNGLRQRSHAGVPLLSHIPFLGRFFGKNGVYDDNKRLYYMVSATIIDLSEQEAMQ